jgi:hydroxymethylpyrimidine/phosphomethylpyrimidine kinase
MKTYKKVLTIAGSDSGGGAGIQADLKTISSLGCFGTSVITAITAQNTMGVTAIHPVPVDLIKKQIVAVLEDIGTDSIKIGMLHSSEIITAIEVALVNYGAKKIVLDPVMVATSGDKLIEDNTVQTLIEKLFPLAALITPNIPEAEILTSQKIYSRDDMIHSALELLDTGCEAVLLKGGHLKGDVLYDIYIHHQDKDNIQVYKNRKIQTSNIHGTGCTLSSAIASFLAHGEETGKAVDRAIAYLQGAIIHGKNYKTGQGNGPVNHFYNPQKLN